MLSGGERSKFRASDMGRNLFPGPNYGTLIGLGGFYVGCIESLYPKP